MTNERKRLNPENKNRDKHNNIFGNLEGSIDYHDIKNYKKRMKEITNPSPQTIEKRNILNWFNRNDYIINKVFLGEWETNDVRYLNYLKERKIKRDRLDELDVIINSN